MGPAEASNDRAPSARPEYALATLRIGLGVIWGLNLLFILYPANEFFPGFAGAAAAYGPTTLGGPGVATVAVEYGAVFSALIAGVTIYLAIAFLLGWTTRLACVVGLGFNAILLLTQYGQIVVVPGGTDVGPQPLYLLAYIVLLVGGANTILSLDRRTRTREAPRPAPSRDMAAIPNEAAQNV